MVRISQLILMVYTYETSKSGFKASIDSVLLLKQDGRLLHFVSKIKSITNTINGQDHYWTK
jgi:hypothetical protein